MKPLILNPIFSSSDHALPTKSKMEHYLSFFTNLKVLKIENDTSIHQNLAISQVRALWVFLPKKTIDEIFLNYYNIHFDIT